ncbi:hypothetical protein F4781DRAFT_437476 [Annulohypoxylon bovei var. microspora]|nr:hypothetical protein F4781DRAFT_437476 [Annulohypoxylon bovei var. microspora]
MTLRNDFEQSCPKHASLEERLYSLPENQRSRGEMGFTPLNQRLMPCKLYGTCASLTPESRVRSSYFVCSPIFGFRKRLRCLEDPVSNTEPSSNFEKYPDEKRASGEDVGKVVESQYGEPRESAKKLVWSIFRDPKLWEYKLPTGLASLIIFMIIIFIDDLIPDSTP